MITQQFASPEEALEHHGTKGMKWGVRKEQYRDEYDSDQTLKKGSTIQNISSKTETNLEHPIYGAVNDLDRLNYRGNYGSYLKEWSGSRTVYQNDLKVVKDIKIPSEKNAVATFRETLASDPEGMARSIARAKADTVFFANLGKSIKMDSESRTYRKLTKSGDEWLNTKGYAQFNKSLTSSKDVKARMAYYSALKQKGYGGLRDIHDVSGEYKSENPILVFDNKSLKKGEAKKLSMREIDAAIKDYDIRSKK